MTLILNGRSWGLFSDRDVSWWYGVKRLLRASNDSVIDFIMNDIGMIWNGR